MSLLGSLWSGIKSIGGSIVGSAVGNAILPGVGGVIGSALGGSAGGGGRLPPSLPASMSGSGGMLPMLTGLSSTGKAAVAAGAAAVGTAVYEYNKHGQLVKKRRRRAKGISGHDLKSFKRVARLIDKFASPVHHLRKSSFKPKAH